MWRRSASFILDNQQRRKDVASSSKPESISLSPPQLSSMADAFQNPNSSNPKNSAYYQTRAAHHGVVTSDWLAQAQAAVGRPPDDQASSEPEVPAAAAAASEPGRPFCVIDEFNNWRKQPDLAEAVAAIRALATVIRSSEATTMMELEIELKKASDSLKIPGDLGLVLFEERKDSFGMIEMYVERFGLLLEGAVQEANMGYGLTACVKELIRNSNVSWDTTSISLTAGCDLFTRYVTRTSALEYEDFNSAKSRLIERAEKFGEISYKARRIIAMVSQDFIFDGCTILVHGFSRVVLEVLKTAAQSKKLFRVFCTEGRPDRTGLRLSNELAKLDVPVKLLIDSAVAYTMDEVDMVFVGADGVVESGGIINMMGTYQIALVAHSMNKPVYVAAESYKFARLYPLDQKDMAPALRPIDFGVPIPSKVEVERSARDYTPPQYLTLLFTDLGVLTPSVVSDELIQLYL
ncbi:Translation initiation factor eIF-2B subunit alpha [Morus notabilis]|uniref:Translation initiation factor eIF2B subunit alpha n=1 Tax=Morus notabilis TaxID=981085 RepID=W9RA83_9ROSA|nr:Translation initiation factor eIF-2B subunit alpha [Morus notabilis]